MAKQARPDPETLFGHLIDFADLVPDYWDELRRPRSGGKFYEWNQFPEVTLLRLEIEARVHYRAGLEILRHRPLAFAADVHARNLIEFMAHVAWIYGASQERAQSSQRDRALCLELGIARALARATAEAQPESVPEGNLKLIEARAAEYDSLHLATGCACRGEIGEACGRPSKPLSRTG